MKRCRIVATTIVFTFDFYFYTLFLDCFSFSFVKIRWEISEIRGTEGLFIDKFGHAVQ